MKIRLAEQRARRDLQLTDISHSDEFLTTAGDDGVNQSASRQGTRSIAPT
jgi:hypothetical protein